MIHYNRLTVIMLLNDAIKSAPEIVEIPRVVLVYT